MAELGEYWRVVKEHRKMYAEMKNGEASPRDSKEVQYLLLATQYTPLTIPSEKEESRDDGTEPCRFSYTHLQPFPSVPATNGRLYWDCYPSFKVRPNEMSLSAFIRLANTKTGWSKKAFERNWQELGDFLNEYEVRVEEMGVRKTRQLEDEILSRNGKSSNGVDKAVDYDACYDSDDDQWLY
jgi:hypothetical protein